MFQSTVSKSSEVLQNRLALGSYYYYYVIHFGVNLPE